MPPLVVAPVADEMPDAVPAVRQLLAGLRTLVHICHARCATVVHDNHINREVTSLAPGRLKTQVQVLIPPLDGSCVERHAAPERGRWFGALCDLRKRGLPVP